MSIDGDLRNRCLLNNFEQYPWALLSLPIISALIGWLTNYIAIKMLFHPRQPLKLGIFTMQGILPRRQADIAVQLGRIVATDLLSSDDLIERLTNDRSRTVYRDFVDAEAEKFIYQKLYKAIPLSRVFLREKTVARLKESLVDELLEKLPDMISRLTEPETGSLDIQHMVETQVLAFSTDRLEKMLHDILAKEFRFIEVLGAVLGFLIGAVQMTWIYFML